MNRGNQRRVLEDTETSSSASLCVLQNSVLKLWLAARTAWFMVPMRVQSWKWRLPMNRNVGQASRLPPVRTADSGTLLALTRSLGRRDACPTLVASSGSWYQCMRESERKLSMKRGNQRRVLEDTETSSSTGLCVLQNSVLKLWLAARTAWFMVPMRVQSWKWRLPMNRNVGQASRLPPVRTADSGTLLALTRSLGRRDACPTLVASSGSWYQCMRESERKL